MYKCLNCIYSLPVVRLLQFLISNDCWNLQNVGCSDHVLMAVSICKKNISQYLLPKADWPFIFDAYSNVPNGQS